MSEPMNPRDLIEYVRARPILVVALALTTLAVGFARSCRAVPDVPPVELLKSFDVTTSNEHFSVTRPIAEVLPRVARPAPPPPATNPPPTILILPATNRSSDLLSIHVPPDPHAPPDGPYAPTGRLLVCVLYNAVDSLGPDAPLIGLVAKDCYHEGHLIVPRGTEVHGRAQAGRARDRIVSQSRWTLVWQDGRELVIAGQALDRHPEEGGQGWALDDGRVGLQGRIIRSQSLDEIKLFLATALSGVASGMQQQTTSFLGLQSLPATARNMGLTATSQVLNTYAQQVLEAIKQDGLYVFVPAGKTFYLYAEVPIDLEKAQVAGSLSRAQDLPEPVAPAADGRQASGEASRPSAGTPDTLLSWSRSLTNRH